MLTLQPLDARMPIQQQLGTEAAPVVLVNLFSADPADAEALLAAWEQDARWMKQQSGYISTQLHRAVGGGSLFLNYAVWESVGHFRSAFSDPAFRSALDAYPSSTVARPHLFEKMAVPDLCTH